MSVAQADNHAFLASVADAVLAFNPALMPIVSAGRDKRIRGYFEANGKFQLDPYWSVTSALRAATDKTVARQYDITRDAELRNFVDAERISANSYISISAWAFQAPAFYKRHGWRVFSEIPCDPPGTSRIFMTKQL